MDEGLILEVFLRECGKKEEGYASEVIRSLGDLILEVELVSDCWESVWELCSAHLIPQEKEEEDKEGEESKEKKKKVDTFSIDRPIQESVILLLGVAWRVCRNKSDKIVQVSHFLSGIMRLCSWGLQLVVLCAIQRVLDFTPSDTALDATSDITQDIRTRVYEGVVPSVLRCVDDTKHASVRGLALKIILDILQKCREFQLNINRGVFDDISIHVRDQISNESNQNIKSRGIEIVTMIEKEFVV